MRKSSHSLITLLIIFCGTNLLSGQYRRELDIKIKTPLKIFEKRKTTRDLEKAYQIKKLNIQKLIPQDDNKEAALVSRINLIRDSGLSLEGEGLSIAAWESGNAITTHPDFQDTQTIPQTRVTQLGGTPNLTSHAAETAGVMISSGEGNVNAKGMAPKAKLRSYNNSTYSDFIPDYTQEVSNEILSNQSLLANNSWSFASGYQVFNNANAWGVASGAKGYGLTEDYIFGFYSSFDVAIDQLLNNSNNDSYTIIFASGNDKNENYNITDNNGQLYPKDCNSGYDCMAWGHGGKNIIAVGAINETTTVDTNSDITLATFSSVGPMDDGRVKPDIVAVGTNMLTTEQTGYSVEATTDGTSFSAPVVTGGSLLIQEYATTELGQNLKGYTLKGLICNTAGELGEYIGPDYTYGWGLFDAKGATDFITNVSSSTFLLDGSTLENNQTKTYYFIPVLDRVTATLSWYDPEGTPVFDFSRTLTTAEANDLLLNNRTSMLVNDLDLRLKNGSTEYKPWTLDPEVPTKEPIRGDNIVDNVEEVYIHTDELKQSIIKATVTHKGTLKDNLGEDFALLINGVQECNVYSTKEGNTTPTWNLSSDSIEKIPDGTDACLVIATPTYIISEDTTFTTNMFSISEDTTLTILGGKTLTINGQVDTVGELIIKPMALLKVQ